MRWDEHSQALPLFKIFLFLVCELVQLGKLSGSSLLTFVVRSRVASHIHITLQNEPEKGETDAEIDYITIERKVL